MPLQSVRLGEALVGEGPEVAHIDLVMCPKGGAVEDAFVMSLASPRERHTLFLAVLEPNLPPRPSILVINKATIKNATQAVLVFGPAQTAVAKAVMDCVEDGTIPKRDAEELLLMVSVFIERDAKDKRRIYEYNYEATKLAIKRAMASEPRTEDVLNRKDCARRPFM